MCKKYERTRDLDHGCLGFIEKMGSRLTEGVSSVDAGCRTRGSEMDLRQLPSRSFL